jgi:integrase
MKQDPTHYPQSTLKELILSLPLTKRNIAILAYATGARVSELNKITPEDIKVNEGYLEISCKVLKKKKESEKNEKRIALIRLDEEWLVKPIQELVALTTPRTPLICYNRFQIYHWLKRGIGINPHMFRALRATHLAQKGYTAHQLKHFFGWSTVAPSDYYVKLNTKDLRY